MQPPSTQLPLDGICWCLRGLEGYVEIGYEINKCMN
jgi:hypothetical protein